MKLYLPSKAKNSKKARKMPAICPVYLHNHSSQYLPQLPCTQWGYNSIEVMSTKLGNSIFNAVFLGANISVYTNK